MTLLAVYDPRRFPKNKIKDNSDSANDDFRNLFMVFELHGIPTKIDPEGEDVFAIFGPTEEINKNWFNENKGCPYLKAIDNKRKKFPLCITERKILKLYETHPSMKPEKEFNSINEILEHYYYPPGHSENTLMDGRKLKI